MSIGPESYYLIRAREKLREIVKGQDFADLISEDHLWSRAEWGLMKSPVALWLNTRIDQVKLLFLLGLKRDYVHKKSAKGNQLGVFLLDTLGLKNISTGIFDQWWDIERFETLAATYESAESQIDAKDWAAIDVAGNSILKEWVAEHLESCPPNLVSPDK